MNPSFDEMEQKRQAMIASFQELAQAMTKCASVVNDFARHAPAIGLTLPTIPVPTITPAAAAPTTKKAKAPSAAPPPPAPPAQTTETEVDSSSISAPAAAATTGAKRGRKPTKEKKAKDPNAPKRPPSAYLLFQNEVREEIKKTLPPGAPYRQILEACSERWKTLPTEEKEDFLRAYQLANEKFVGDEKAYKNGPQAAAFAAQNNGTPAIAPADSSDSSDSDSSDSSDSDDTDAAPAPAIAAPRPSVPAQPQFHSPAVSLGAAAAAAAGTPTSAGKKHKKDAAEDGTEKKKKKKSKLSEA